MRSPSPSFHSPTPHTHWSFGETMAGSALGISMVGFLWLSFSSIGLCLFGQKETHYTWVHMENWRQKCWHDPWSRAVEITGLVSLCLWLLSLRTIPKTKCSDASFADRAWPFLPCLYCWHWLLSSWSRDWTTPRDSSASDTVSPRLLITTLLVTVWGARLVANYALKGGFGGGEDYRWQEIRAWFPGWRWEVFNLVFICGYQQVVILAIVSPAVCAAYSTPPLNSTDAWAAGLFVFFIAGESVADWQMWRFQAEKHRRLTAGEELGPAYERGFIETGLWAYSRHPNYFCEVAAWWAFYLFSTSATGLNLNWTLTGPVCYTLLFTLPHASIDLTEILSARKYPAYVDYQRRVSRFVPWWPAKGPAESRGSSGFPSPKWMRSPRVLA